MIAETRWKVLCVGLVVGLATTVCAQPYTKCVTKFETGEGFAAGDEVLFQAPGYSGSTRGIFCDPDPANGECREEDPLGNPWGDSQVVNWAGLPWNQAYEIYFVWKDPLDLANTGGVRATTYQADNLERPSVHLGGKVRFNMAVVAYLTMADVASDPYNPSGVGTTIEMAMGIRETGNVVAQGETDTGSGDIEFVYLPGSENIPPADSNGFVSWPPGGKRFTATGTWPPPAGDWQTVTFDLGNTPSNRILGFALDGDGIDTAGDGMLDATSNGDGVNRGVLEGLYFSNTGSNGKVFYIYIDDVEFEAPVPDPIEPPSKITGPSNAPVTADLTQVVVHTKYNLCDSSDVDQAELFMCTNGCESLGTKVPSGGEAKWNIPADIAPLQAGDVLRATQTFNGVTSDLSYPVLVTPKGTYLVDNFDAYASQAGLNELWHNSINYPDPPDAKVQLTTGGATTCQNMLKEENPAGADAARLYRHFGDVYPTDAKPLWVSWYFQHRGASGAAGERTKFELARMQGGTWSASSDARLSGTTGIVLENGPASVPLPDTLDQYNILLKGCTTNGFFAGNQGQVSLTGVDRESDVWHKFQIQVKSEVINYYIDDVPANPVDSNGPPGYGAALWPGGVPRPADSLGQPYNFIIIGQGYSNNGPAMLFDSIVVNTNGVVPWPPNLVGAPDVVSPLFPGGTLVTVVNVNSNATDVTVYADGGQIATTNGVGEFLDNTATLVVAALSDGNVITATQTLGGTESCYSAPVVVAVPQVTVQSILVPTQTIVQVSDLEEGLAQMVTVYRVTGTGTKVSIGSTSSPTQEPVGVTVSALSNGDEIVATQTISNVVGPDSDSVIVAVPAPTVAPGLLPGDTVVTVEDLHLLLGTVTVYVNDTPTPVNTTGETTVAVPVTPALAPGDEVWATQTIGGVEGPDSDVITIQAPICLIVFEDDFETDTSANWNVIKDNADTAATFAWDYHKNAGVPACPNASTSGLKLEVNLTQGATTAVTVSPIGYSFTGADGVVLEFDMWINAHGPFPAGGSGSTESFTAGVGYDDTTVNFAWSTGGMGSGAWFAITGEGGASYDVCPFKDAEMQWPASGQFHAKPDLYANNTNYHEFYADLFGDPGPAPPAAQAAIWTEQYGDTYEGSAGFAWHHVKILVSGTKARWSINDTPIVTLDTTIGNPFSGLDGNISLGMMDLWGSLSGPPGFGLADNVRILRHHTPGTNGDFDGDADVDLTDYRYFAECLAGPDATPTPDTGPACGRVCLEVFDFDVDDDVDVEDFAEFQVQFGS